MVTSVVDPDPGPVESASFCRIRTAFQGRPIRIRICIHFNQIKKLTFFPENLNMLSKILDYNTYDTDEKDKTV